MIDLISAIGLVLLLEGLMYAVFTERMKRVMLIMLATPVQHIRTAGIISAAIGFFLIWLVRGH